MSDFEGNNQLQKEGDRVETLRLILERKQSKPITYAEASEVAESLISFFEILADDTEANNAEGDQEAQGAPNRG